MWNVSPITPNDIFTVKIEDDKHSLYENIKTLMDLEEDGFGIGLQDYYDRENEKVAYTLCHICGGVFVI